jgi:hypothetical protein
MHLYHHTQSLAIMGLTGFECLVSPRIVSLGYGFIDATDGCAVGDIAFSWLCFISALLVGWLGEPRGLYPMYAKYCYKAKMEPFSFVHNLSYHENCHPVSEVNFGIPCVRTVGLRGSHR